jgi:SWI/SNF-related matrix-associated actin-dependent regulator of chromatin subfamily A member 5
LNGVGNSDKKEQHRLLNVLMQLRKAANHPYLFEGVEDRTLAEDDVEHLIANSGSRQLLQFLFGIVYVHTKYTEFGQNMDE